ncbi:MAG: branched-chain alpha-keto acid dehydrogenase subunit E2 [Chromatiales bacterium]|nr:branched-chain alpha-keto acid dehydrogenase subunit E2 [Chromatiales bacterium]
MPENIVAVPDIGEFEGIPVIDILVATKDIVEAGQSLLTLESDKATLDIPAPYSGIVGRILVTLNDLVSEGSPLLELERTPTDADTRTADGATPDEPTSPETDVSERHLGAPTSPIVTTPAPATPGSRSHASPAVRRFARTLGVELGDVTGTAAKGRILRTDVERYVKQRLSGGGTEAHTTSGHAIPPVPAIDYSKFGPITTQPLSRIQRISGPFLHRSWLNIPHVTYQDEADITELEAFRKSLSDDPDTNNTRITPLAFFVKALCKGLRKFPVFNASLTPDGQSLVFKQYTHIGVAVDTPNGLVVPVIRDADGKGLLELAQALSEVSARARRGKLKPDDLKGGSMTISSLGGIGGTGFTPIVNAPEVAILGIARAKVTPVWNGHTFEPRLMLPLCLSFDHRVIDGAVAARFMSYLCGQFKETRKLLL